jgi:formiminotetrahydrofolate cyclodeaminase
MNAPDLADLPLRELLERLAAPTPAPGGGSAAAAVCGVAASLVQMAAGFGPRPDAPPAGGASLERAGARASELRALALELAEAEMSSYAPVLKALRRPASDPARGQRLSEALTSASVVPLRIAATGAEVAALAARTAAECRPHLNGDAITAALLAGGACSAASRLVQINLASEAGDPRLQQAANFADQAAASSEAALATGSASSSR